mgnify:CR=1 FL=1
MNNENAIIQNLKDAGCDEDTIQTFVEDLRKEKVAEGLKLLATHRRSLLDDLHKDQKQIDCLDYLVYKLEKDQKMKA